MIKQVLPFKVNPIVVPTVWAGTELGRMFDLDKNLQAGEVWFFSTLPGSESVAVEGEFRGYSINEIMKKASAAILGPALSKKHGRKFPVLIKYLNASTPLSVQVHPHSKTDSKTEMWHVIKAAKKAKIWLGMKKKTTVKKLKEAVEHGSNAGALLNQYTPKAGDTYFVPAGTVHALGAGSVIFEVQQNSYTTYRLYDWGRRGRQLHIKEGFASLLNEKRAGFVKHGKEPKVEGLSWSHILECEHFACASVTSETDMALYAEGGTPVILSVISGKVAIAGKSGIDCEVESSQMALVPFSYKDFYIKIKRGTSFILTEVR